MLLQKSSCFQLLLLRRWHFIRVVTHLRCGGIFIDSIIANFLLILTLNKFENQSIFDEVTAYKTKCASFLGHPVYTVLFLRFKFWQVLKQYIQSQHGCTSLLHWSRETIKSHSLSWPIVERSWFFTLLNKENDLSFRVSDGQSQIKSKCNTDVL